MEIIDLRSDTVTRPTPAMLEAMMSAPVGDDVFASDPSVNALQDYVASAFKKDAALFCPSGTMTNQIAIALQSGPLTEVITEANSHVYSYEVGGISFHARASVKPLVGDRGRISAEQVAAAINPDDLHKPRSALVCVENTTNRGGGACYDWHALEKIRALCQQNDLNLHLDGARLFNAAIKEGIAPAQYASLFDTLSVCLSKGLGAPVGSLLVGDNAFINRARRMRKVMGGGMRQAGYLAAAGLYALQHHVERLVEDHQLARSIADLLREIPYVDGMLEPETNIVIFKLAEGISPREFIQHLGDNHIKAGNIGGQWIRFVTHLDVNDNDLNPIRDVLRVFRA